MFIVIAIKFERFYEMLKKFFTVFVFSITSFASTAQDAYDGVYLTIPKVAIANTLYRNVKISVGQVLAVNGGTPTKDYDTYIPATNTLSIPSVVVGGSTYTNVQITVGQVFAVGESGPLSTLGFADYNFENSVIKSSFIPNEVNLNRSATFWGVGTVAPLIPAFDGTGLLLASWTPSTKPDAPTFVIAHGGGGMDASLFVLGVDLRAMGDANILILDSIWSRGRTTNGGDSIKASGKTLSSNARMFDLVAAGRWLSTQGVNPDKTYAVGLSQGGWGVLRAFTNDPMITELVKPLYAGGISVVPMCEEPGTKHTEEKVFAYHKLGPYHSKVLLITGALDTLTPVSYCSDSTLKSVDKWLHWDDAGHGFFDPIVGSAFQRAVDGTCETMVNGFGTHLFCYNEKRAKQMLDEIRVFSSMSAQ
jgi:dienelactone hydrolase